MDWKKLISELVEEGLTQQKIAEACGVRQSVISELRSGKIKDPRWTYAERLRILHERKTRRSSRSPKSVETA
jgi:predicted transcriptional regulator